jgi:hypothetical protein
VIFGRIAASGHVVAATRRLVTVACSPANGCGGVTSSGVAQIIFRKIGCHLATVIKEALASRKDGDVPSSAGSRFFSFVEGI